jgi:hypothetical protein
MGTMQGRPTGIGTKPMDDGYRPRNFDRGLASSTTFTWLNLGAFMVALAITSCPMAWGVIIAIGRLICRLG